MKKRREEYRWRLLKRGRLELDRKTKQGKEFINLENRVRNLGIQTK
jgi:hypothetical protein